MKFLNSPVLITANQELSSQISDESQFYATLECFEVSEEDYSSGKTQSFDRGPFQGSYGQSPDSYTGNPMYSLITYASSRHYPALKAAISNCFPDYDFTNVMPWNFKMLQSADQAYSDLIWPLNTYVEVSHDLQQKIWSAIDSEISVNTCSIYKYEPDGPDAFSERGLYFSLTMLFLNEKDNKVLIVHMQKGDGDTLSDNEGDDLLESRFGFGIF